MNEHEVITEAIEYLEQTLRRLRQIQAWMEPFQDMVPVNFRADQGEVHVEFLDEAGEQ